MKTEVCKIVDKFSEGVTLECKDEKGEEFLFSVAPHGFRNLKIGSFYLCDVYSDNLNGFAMNQARAIRPCTAEGGITGGKIEVKKGATEFFTIVEKDPEKGIRIYTPFGTVSDFFKIDRWELTEPGMVVSGIANHNHFRINGI